MKFVFGFLVVTTIAAFGGVWGYMQLTGGDIYDITEYFSEPYEISGEKLIALYEKERPGLIADYQSQGNAYAKAYTSYRTASTLPANPGVHSGRYMMTYVNDVGYDKYVEFGAGPMPIGTIIAKESFKIRPNGDFFPYTLFIMEKVGVEITPETGGWIYDRIYRDGKPAGANQEFCHSCHVAFSNQDSLGYPVNIARIGYEPPDPNAAKVVLGDGDAARGEGLFDTCLGCHDIGPDAVNKFGPVLTEVVGRTAASYPGYSYSGSLKTARVAGLAWTDEQIFEWLAGPSDFLRNYLDDPSASSKMPIQIDDPQERNDIIAYLRSQSQRGSDE